MGGRPLVGGQNDVGDTVGVDITRGDIQAAQEPRVKDILADQHLHVLAAVDHQVRGGPGAGNRDQVGHTVAIEV